MLVKITNGLPFTTWRAVEAVAAALLTHERLEALEIYRIVVGVR